MSIQAVDGQIRAFSMLLSWQGKLTSQGSRKVHLTPTIWLWGSDAQTFLQLCMTCGLQCASSGTWRRKKPGPLINIAVLCPTHEAESNIQKTACVPRRPFSHHLAGTPAEPGNWDSSGVPHCVHRSSSFPLRTLPLKMGNIYMWWGHLSSRADSENCFLEIKVLVVINNFCCNWTLVGWKREPEKIWDVITSPLCRHSFSHSLTYSLKKTHLQE